MPRSAARQTGLPIADQRTTSTRLIWLICAPVLGQNVLGIFVGWSDTILTGRILVEERFVAAVTVGSYLLWLMHSVGAVVWMGSQAIVARLIGAGAADEANEIVAQSVVTAVGVGIASLFAFFFGANWLVSCMQLSGPALGLASDYVRIIAIGCPPMMVMLVATSCLRAAGHTLAGMWIEIAVNVTNVACSWSLALGVGPLPQLGFRGIAMGTLAGYLVGGALATMWLWRGHRELRLPRRLPVPKLSALRRVLRIGVPGAANALAVVLCHLWFVSIIGRLGDAAVAAHGVAIRCESISWLSAEAFAVAAATLVGQSLGARRADLARAYGRATFRIGAVVMSLMGVLFWLRPQWLFWIFVPSEDSEILDLGVPVLRLVAFGMPALAAAIILTGALRGAGDTRWPFVYNTAGLLLIRIPLAYALTGEWLSLGLYGAWIAMVADLYVRGVAAMIRFNSDGWTRIRV